MNCKYLRRNKLKHDHSGISKNCRIQPNSAIRKWNLQLSNSAGHFMSLWSFGDFLKWGTWYLVSPSRWNMVKPRPRALLLKSLNSNPPGRSIRFCPAQVFRVFFCCFPIVVVERYTRYLGKLPEVAYEARLGQDPVRSLERPFAPSNPGTFYARAVDGT
jgi:hypothetical protein